VHPCFYFTEALLLKVPLNSSSFCCIAHILLLKKVLPLLRTDLWKKSAYMRGMVCIVRSLALLDLEDPVFGLVSALTD
jgi:hypothetical protein